MPRSTNPYADGVACEHTYVIGQCGEPAKFVVAGLALCSPHFEDWVEVRVLVEEKRLRDQAVRL